MFFLAVMTRSGTQTQILWIGGEDTAVNEALKRKGPHPRLAASTAVMSIFCHLHHRFECALGDSGIGIGERFC